ncbi:MAG TPA: hypothetical protein VFB62_09285 [Polyangiaceae bacterium]|nr:hypothetical protein [Polyangiaceae bacterium]
MDARVDLNKLQILNDRICQTIDALNQVRLSVRAVNQVTGIASPYTSSQVGFQHSTPWAYGAMGSVSPWSNPFALQGLTGLTPMGLQHSVLGNAVPYGSSAVPYGSSAVPYGASPHFPQGLQHSTQDLYELQLAQIRAQDPFRVAQTFPFAFTSII